MSLKGKFKNKPSLFRLLLLIILIFSSVLIFTSISYGYMMILLDTSLNGVIFFFEDLTNTVVIYYLKVLQAINTISLFIIPSIIFSYLCGINLKLHKIPNRQIILISSVIILLINPLINYLYQLNKVITLPEWMILYEIKVEVLTKAFLVMNNISDMFINILIIAFIASLAEELFFRGVLQQMFIKWSGKVHLSILITAALFSAVHMQFHGFLPRFVLGIFLGYLFYWNKNLWVPIIAHFLNNAVIILFSYYPIKEFIPLDISRGDVSYGELFFSIGGVVILLFLLKKRIKVIE